MRRSLAAAGAMSAVLVAAAIPLLGSASAAACPAWTDAKGDASTGMQPNPTGLIGDNNLDIAEATFKTDGTNLTATIGVVKLSSSSSDVGDEHHVEFTIGGKVVLLYSDRTIIDGVKMPYGNYVGFYNVTDDEIASGGTATYDTKTNTVTITAPVANLAKALGSTVAGKAATNLKVATFNQVNGVLVAPYDVAPATAGTTLMPAAACGGTGPAPTTPPTTAPPTSSPSPSPSPSPTGSVPAGYPAAGCNTYADPKGDGKPTPATVEGNAIGLGNDPDLDILGAAFNTTADDLQVFIRIDKLGKSAAQGDGHRFEWTFTFNGKAFVLVGGQFGTISDNGRAAGAFAAFPFLTVGGTRNSTVTPTQILDVANSMVVMSVKRADIVRLGGAELEGALTGVTTLSKLVTPTGGWILADTASEAKVEDRTYTVGVSPCFGPPAAKLLSTGRTSVQFGDAAALAAKLTSSAGAPLAGKAVTFAIGSVRKTATTGSDGVARASLAPTGTAGAYTLVTSFAGDAGAGKVELSTPFTVTAEATRIAMSVVKSGTKRTVLAKLTDDDGKALAGQSVNWYVAGKKVATTKTNSSGVATLTTAKPTQTVVAEFLAVAGKYAASKATTKA